MTSVDEVDPPLQVLVVEDNPTDRSWLVLMLDGADLCPHREAYAETVAAAEAMLHDEAFDCVLLDLRLPDCDGIDSVRRVVGAAPDTPVVVFTGGDERELGLASIQAGAQDFLVKGQVTGNGILRAARWAAIRHDRRHPPHAAGPPFSLGSLTAPWACLDADLVVLATGEGFGRALDQGDEAMDGRSFAGLLRGDGAAAAIALLHQVATGELHAAPVRLPASAGRARLVAAHVCDDAGTTGVVLIDLGPDVT